MNKTAAKAADQLEKKRLAATTQEKTVANALHPDIQNPQTAANSEASAAAEETAQAQAAASLSTASPEEGAEATVAAESNDDEAKAPEADSNTAAES
jgi:hypothetical protein